MGSVMRLLANRSSEVNFRALSGQSRQELEQHSVDTASTSDAVTFITYVQSLKRKIKQFEKQVEVSSRRSDSSRCPPCRHRPQVTSRNHPISVLVEGQVLRPGHLHSITVTAAGSSCAHRGLRTTAFIF